MTEQLKADWKVGKQRNRIRMKRDRLSSENTPLIKGIIYAVHSSNRYTRTPALSLGI